MKNKEIKDQASLLSLVWDTSYFKELNKKYPKGKGLESYEFTIIDFSKI